MNDVALAATTPAAPASGGTARAYRVHEVIMRASGATPEEIRSENRGGIGDGYHEESDGACPTPARIFAQRGSLRPEQLLLSR